MRLRRWRAVLVAALTVAAVAVPSVAHAHTALRSSTPGEGQVLAESIDHVSLTFTSPVSATGNTVLVSDQAGHPFTTGDSEGQRDTVTQPVTPLPTGIYTIAYRVFAADGNPTTGTVTFTVHLPGDPAPAAAPEPDHSDAAPASGAGTAIAIAVTAAVLFGQVRRRHNRRRHDADAARDSR